MSRTNIQMGVVLKLATSYDLRCCISSSRKGEMLRLVFTE